SVMHCLMLTANVIRQHCRLGRTSMVRRVALFACLLASVVATPALAQNVSPTLAELANYNGPDRTQRLIAGAKKEGSVTTYSTITVDDQKALTAGFEKQYGVKLQFWRASSESILQRALVEYRGGRYEVDAIETSAAEMESLHREKLLVAVNSPHLA